MSPHEPNTFFKPGGTLDPTASCYVERQTDKGFVNALLAGEFVYLLDSRQKGKCSLIGRAIRQLRESGGRTAKLDLQRIGANVSTEQWYAGLLSSLGRELGLSKELFHYWGEHQGIGPLARWIGATPNSATVR